MENNLNTIRQLLLQKSSAKQQAFRHTREVFQELRNIAGDLAKNLNTDIHAQDPNVEIRFYDKSEFEFHLKFSGDTLVFMMHTNIFDFEDGHFIRQTPYIQEDSMREFCGMIQVYNFLADSIKFNREGDLGFLVCRIFVNKEKHFFVEGKRPLNFLFSDIANCCINPEQLETIVTECMLYCLNFDLIAPPFETLSFISVEQKNLMSYSSGMPTGKMLGFRNQADDNSTP